MARHDLSVAPSVADQAVSKGYVDTKVAGVGPNIPYFGIRAATASGAFGAGVWQALPSFWVAETYSPRGRSGVFSYPGSGSVITVLEDGLYAMTYNLSVTNGGSSTGIAGRLWHSSSRALSIQVAPILNMTLSGAMTWPLGANNTVTLQIYNFANLINWQPDLTSFANNFSITKLDG